jgi:hypothetical protein
MPSARFSGFRIGRVSYFGDTARFRAELVPDLAYADFQRGIREMLQ